MWEAIADAWPLILLIGGGVVAIWYFVRGDPYRVLFPFDEGALGEMSQLRSQLEAQGVRCKVRTEVAREPISMGTMSVRIPSAMALVVHRADLQKARAILGEKE